VAVNTKGGTVAANTRGEQAASESGTVRRTRANGEQSRQRILDAATEVATERGYEGTTISLVSKKSGLPPTSIYWHFADKDDLIAAVIERSFLRWMGALDLPGGLGGSEVRARAIELGTQVAKALLDSPDFLRLGLMLALERRPVEPRAREMFLQVRADGLITTYALAGTDGLFIAKEVGGDSVNLIKLFDLHSRLVFDAAVKLLADSQDEGS
jgi:AcrR family transcriptional regulator